jgi:ABC-2 type transport system permease protein
MSGEAIPRAAFGTLVRSEVRLAWRQPVGLVFGLGLPLVLLVVFGSIPGFRHAQANLGGATYFGVYLPILVTLVLAALGLASLPTPVATYREQGILRRLSTTPVPPSYVLAAQLLINLCIAAGSMVILLVLGTAVFGAGTPRSVIGLAVAVVLSAAAIFAIGLLVAAVARTGAAAGLISDWTPLGASVRALQAALQTGFPPLASLAVLAGYALVFGWLSVRFFVWQ